MIAASAQAETIEVNLYGASAQFKFWTATAPEFLKNKLGCAEADIYHGKNKVEDEAGTADRDAGFALCAGNTAITNNGTSISGSGAQAAGYSGQTIIVRYTTNASYDGIRAVTGWDDGAGTGDPDGCGSFTQREMADLTTAQLGSYAAGGTSIPNLVCKEVVIGASDVDATTFDQESHGYLKGPKTGQPWEDRNIRFSLGNIPDARNVDGIVSMNPIVVPFGFFASEDVPYDNLSRLMAVSLFSGSVGDWSEFTGETESKPVVLCLRHAGSGTAATLNAAVMRGDGAVPVYSAYPGDSMDGMFMGLYDYGITGEIYFNKGSSDVIKCLNDATTAYAIGYADADKCKDGCSGVKELSYGGFFGTSDNIKNGLYSFWSAQSLFSNATGNAVNVVADLNAYASDEANMPASKAGYWAAQDAMKVKKDTDFSYITRK